MPLGLPVALALAQAAAAAPPTAEPCKPNQPGANPNEIIICAERPEGFRIDPDILTVKRIKRGGSGGRPVRPNLDGTRDATACAVGPTGCPSAGVNLLGAALTAAEMAKRLAQGKEVGSMFVTDPQMSEYQLYQLVKQAREAEEADKALQAKIAQMRAKQAAEPATNAAQ